MIILRLGGGQANQMYEFAAGYALAKALNRELILDISSYIEHFRGYQLDYLCIPDLKKIFYRNKDAYDIAHTSGTNIPLSLLTIGKAYSDVNFSLADYKGIFQAKELKGNPIYLCGFFSLANFIMIFTGKKYKKCLFR